MKIIKAGKKRKTTYRFHCRDCACVFECDEDEGKLEFLPRNETIFTVKCPECKRPQSKEL